MSEEGITLTVWGNDGMPSDVIEGVERIVVYLLKNERSKVKAGLSDRGYCFTKSSSSISAGRVRDEGIGSADSDTL